MKGLRIKDGKGEYSLDGTNYSSIEEIKKEDILSLLDVALQSGKELEMDEYDASLISHPAHKIIYNSLHEKFKEVISSKEQFIDEIGELYQDAYEKYKVEETDDDGDRTKI